MCTPGDGAERRGKQSLRVVFPRSLLETRPRARSGNGKLARRRPTTTQSRPRSVPLESSARASTPIRPGARGQPRLRPPPATPRPPGPAQAGSPPPRDSHVRVPPEGVGDVLHHPLHQHRHLFACLRHVGGGRSGSGAPPGERPAAGGSPAGSARVCAGWPRPRPLPWSLRSRTAATEHFRVSQPAAREWRLGQLPRPGWLLNPFRNRVSK